MRRRWAISLGAAIIVVVVAITFWPSVPDPEYRGKKLSEWLAPYAQPGMTPGNISKEDREAVRAVGTNGIPLLLNWIRKETPLWRRGLPAWRAKAPTSISGNSVVRAVMEDPGVSHGSAACAGFLALGAGGRSAVPELTAIAMNAKTPEAARNAVHALGFIGQDAFSPLLAVLADPRQAAESRSWAAYWLGQSSVVGTNASRAVPILILSLSDPDLFVCIKAANSLGMLAAEPEVVVPALINALEKGNNPQRKFAAMALENFGARAKDAVPALWTMTSDKMLGMREVATNSLAHIAPEVLSNGPSHF